MKNTSLFICKYMVIEPLFYIIILLNSQPYIFLVL